MDIKLSQNKEKINTSDIYIILYNIRSVHNVGSIFRTSECAGVSKIYCIGETPTPIDKFGKPRKDFVKVSLGSEKNIDWKYSKTISPILNKLKKEKYNIIAIEQFGNSVDYKKAKPFAHKNVFIMGNEVSGIPESILKKCDQVAEIKMLGEKESLNVSVAFGVAIFRILGI